MTDPAGLEGGPPAGHPSETAATLHPIPGRTPTTESGPWRIAVASDHRGQQVKGRILDRIRELGHTAEDFGPGDEASVDYPDFAAEVAESVGTGKFDRGILICGSGLGMCIVANKFPGVRAAPCHDDLSAEVSRLHNDANVL
ncbi:MAG: RpiB/LacA/LacB family sugar-phosphate isomerase, partial [Planctomycetota bacterium]